MITIYTCEYNWEAMLTTIYDAWTSGKGQANIRLMIEPILQYSLFEEYIHVDADKEKAEKVMDAVNMKISQYFYHELAYVSMSYEKDAFDTIFRVMMLGFKYGESALSMMQYEPVMRFRQIRKYIGSEVNHFQEFTRFNSVGSFYVAHIEPKSKLVVSLGPIFQDRMPSENWMIIDDKHMEAVIHRKDENYYLWKLTEDELERLKSTEEENDEYTDMWKAFFKTIAIEQRTNKRCQNNLFPIWTRKHVVEFLNN